MIELRRNSRDRITGITFDDEGVMVITIVLVVAVLLVIGIVSAIVS